MRALLIGLGFLLCPCAQAEDPLARAIARWLRAYCTGELDLGAPAGDAGALALYQGALARHELQTLTHELALAMLLERTAATGSAAAAHETIRLAALDFDRKTRWQAFRVCERAVRTLGALQDGGALQHVADTARGVTEPWGRDWSPALQAAALRGLGASGRPVFRPLIERQLAAAERRVRLAAAEAIGELAPPQALPSVRDAIAREGDAVVADALVSAARAIVRARPAEVDARELRRACAACIALLGRTDWRTDITAIAWLEEMRCRDAIPALIETLAVFRDRPDAVAAGRLSGLLRHRAHEALRSLTGAWFPADQPDAWRAFWERERTVLVVPATRSAVTDATHTVAAGFYGIPVRGSRVAFVIDGSGSMDARDVGPTTAGATSRLDVAKRELWRAVAPLPADTRFLVVVFASGVIAWKPQPVPASDGNKAALQRALAGLVAEGGTNLFGGLERALGLKHGDHAERDDVAVDEVFLLSDGAPSAGELTDPELILERVRAWNRYRQVRINTVAVGTGADAPFMRRLAEQNGGVHVRL